MNAKYLILAALAVILFLGTVYFISAQPAAIAAAQAGGEDHVISVTGEATVNMKPDQVVLTFGVLTEGDTAKAAQAENARVVDAVLQAVKGLGIEEKDLRTQGLSLQPKYEYRQDRAPRIVGYQANVRLQVKSDRVDDVGGVVDTVISAGANTLDGVSFQVKDTEKVKQAGIDEAVDNARSQAERIAQKLGLELTGTRSLTVSLGGDQTPPVYLRSALDQSMMKAAEYSAPVMPGENEFRVVVAATFLVKN